FLAVRRAPAGDVFRTVDRADMRRIAAEIGPADAERLAIGVDPLPQHLGRDPALRAVVALGADDIGRHAVAVAAARAAAVIGAVGGGLQAARDRLAIVVTERTGDARREAGGFSSEQRSKQLLLKTLVHAADDVIHHRHAGVVGRLGILPAKILVDQFREAAHHGDRFAPALD